MDFKVMMVMSVDCLKIHGIGIRSPSLFGTPGQSLDLTSNPFQYHPLPSNSIGQTGPKRNERIDRELIEIDREVNEMDFRPLTWWNLGK